LDDESQTVLEAGAGSDAHRSPVSAAVVQHFLRQCFAEDRRPKLLIDSHCNVLWCSEDSERLLQAPLPLSIEDGKLCAAGNSASGAWPLFIENLGSKSRRLLLTGAQATHWILVRGWAERHGEHRLVFLSCELSTPLRGVTSSGLAADFGLTRSECAVLDEFATLTKPALIAQRLNVSLSTVRSHLKQIHTKLSVNSSIQLLRITRAYCDN